MRYRYEIGGGKTEWEEAEKLVEKATKSGKSNPLVSVKTHKAKRKAEPEEAEVNGKDHGDRGHGKSKKAKRDKRK